MKGIRLKPAQSPDLIIWENSRDYKVKLWLLFLALLAWELGVTFLIRYMVNNIYRILYKYSFAP